jgi:hypothetical protein
MQSLRRVFLICRCFYIHQSEYNVLMSSFHTWSLTKTIHLKCLWQIDIESIRSINNMLTLRVIGCKQHLLLTLLWAKISTGIFNCVFFMVWSQGQARGAARFVVLCEYNDHHCFTLYWSKSMKGHWLIY